MTVALIYHPLSSIQWMTSLRNWQKWRKTEKSKNKTNLKWTTWDQSDQKLCSHYSHMTTGDSRQHGCVLWADCVSSEIGGNLPLTFSLQVFQLLYNLPKPPFSPKLIVFQAKGRGKSTLVQGQLQHMSEKLMKFEDSMFKKWLLLKIPEHSIIFLHKIVFLKKH